MARPAQSWSFPAAAERPWVHLREVAEGSPATREQEAFNVVDRAKAEEQITNEYLGRYPIELLQNAQDACAESKKGGRVWMEVTKSALIVANEGQPFDERRVRALMRYSDSSKSADKGSARTIGFKGIGFSAVFEICDNPQVISGGLGFQLDRERATAEVTSALGRTLPSVPVRGYPFRLVPSDLGRDLAVVERLQDAGAVTVIRLPFRSGIDSASVAQACQDVLAIETLLFMPAVRGLSLGGEIPSDSWSRKRGREFAGGTIHHLRNGHQTQAWVVRRGLLDVDDAGRAALVGTMWEEVAHLNYAIAIPLDGRKPKAGLPGQKLHVYFPTGARLGRSVLVHGDFFVNASRTTLATDAHHRPVNDALRRKTAELLASTLELLCAEGVEDPISVLAPAGEADQFGTDWWEDVKAAVAQRQILPPAVPIRDDEDCTGIEPAEAEWLRASSLGPTLRAALEPSLQRVSPTLESGPAAEVLAELGVRHLAPNEIASGLDPSTLDPNYGRWLSELGAWFLALPNPTRPTEVLKDRPILRSTTGDGWLPAKALMIAESLGARLPAFSVRPEVRTTCAEDVELARALGVPELDLGRATATVLADLAALERPTETDHEQALRFFTTLWNRDPSSLRAACPRLGELPVPVRDASGSKRAWRRADSVYFGRDWQQDSRPEALYGHLGRAEFLAATPPDNPNTRRNHLARFEGFGVARSPRRLPVQPNLEWQWKHSADFRSAAKCGYDHHSPDQFQATTTPTCLDRLDTLLGGGDRAALGALRAYLGGNAVTINPDLQIKCRGNEDCRRRNRPTRVVSVEAWLLATKPWIPLLDDDRLVRPEEAWTGYTKRSRALVVQWADLPEAIAQKFGVSLWDRPTARAIERELLRLQALDPDLEDERTVATASQLVRKLSAAVGARTPAPLEDPVFPARLDGDLVWDDEPLLNDLIGVNEVPGVPVLVERVPPRVAERYGLEPLSARTKQVPRPTLAGEGGPRYLDDVWRALTVAVLEVDGADVERAAMAIGRLEEHPCTELEVTLLLDDEPVGEPMDRNMLLKRTVTREGSTSRARGDLYWVQPFDITAFTRYLADYLDEGSRLHLLAGPMMDPDVAKEMSGITPEDLARAAEVIARYATPRPTPAGWGDTPAPGGDDEPGPDDESAEEQGDEGDAGGGSSTGSDENDHGGSPEGSKDGESETGGAGSGGNSSGADGDSGSGNHASTGSGNQHERTGGQKKGSSSQGSKKTPSGSRTRAVTYVATDDAPVDQEERERQSQNIQIGDAGVDAVMAHERAEGRVPEKMAHNNKGFDIRSVDGDRTRIIEVKSTTGAWGGYGVALTASEYEKAGEDSAEFWLYVVEHALTRPKIWKIRDPRSQITQYWFDHGWKKLAEKAPRPRH